MVNLLTLLLTDVVDSTLLNDRHGDAVMGSLWAGHDRYSRELMRTWRAREVGRSDGFLLLFADVVDAVGFAHGYHAALDQLAIPLRARVGIHTGQVLLRNNTAVDVERGAPALEVDGLALPLAARLMAAACGHQTLISSEAKEALASCIDEGHIVIRSNVPSASAELGSNGGLHAETKLRLHSHGYWRLKGIETPTQIFQIGTANEDFAPPPDSAKAYRVVSNGVDWLPLRVVPHRLPVERDLFVGRADALNSLAARFDAGNRLISLLGVGGIGKTRLSLRYARKWLGEYPGGAWLCDLSAALSADGIIYGVAKSLDVPLDKTDPNKLIGAAISARGKCLIILDNFEQVARHAEETLGAWMELAPDARFIVTSRELLGIAGEHAMFLAPLALPEAEQLLKDRMSSTGLKLEQSDAEYIRPLVELLDCLPLTIELAAARTRVMRPAELLSRMGERFKLLATRSGRHDRQATLRATLNWSWDLLSHVEKSALAQCSVFQGGFTLAAAEKVIDLSAVCDAPWVGDVVQALVEKSLLKPSETQRFDLLRSVHDYAAEHLPSNESSRGTTMRRHWNYFASFDERAAVTDRCIEAENLVTACRRATEALHLDAAVRALIGAWAALNLTGPFNVAIQMADRLYLVAFPNAMSVAMTARWVSGSARYLAGDIVAAQADLEAATWEGGDVAQRARALCALGQLERSIGNLERADDLLNQGLRFANDSLDAGLICRGHNAIGTLRMMQGRLEDAHKHFTTGLTTACSSDDLKQQAALLGNIGVVERKLGNLESAVRNYKGSLVLAQQIGDVRFEGNMRLNLGFYYYQVGEFKDALLELNAAWSIAQSAGLTRLSANGACNLALVEQSLGHSETASNWFQVSTKLAGQLRDRILLGHFQIYFGRFLARSGRDSDAQQSLDESERLLSDCIDGGVLGLLACAKAELAVRTREWSTARYWLSRALKQLSAERGGAAGKSELTQEVENVRALFNSH